MRFILPTRKDTDAWGRKFGAMLLPGDVIALIGDIGAGKTTLTQAIAAGLGVKDPVTSPTFTLIQEYAGRTPLYHFDPYRLDNPEEVLTLGFDEYVSAGGVLVFEWADRIRDLLPPDRFEIEIADIQTENEAPDIPRDVTITGYGQRPLAVVAVLEQIAGGAGR